MRIQKSVFLLGMLVSSLFFSPIKTKAQAKADSQAQTKPKITLDEFFNYVSFDAIELSPDGNSVVIATERADWDRQIFRSDLWLWREDGRGGSLIQLTQSGHDSDPKWSPNGKWIAFMSERKMSSEKSSDSDSDTKDDETSQIYLISPAGGEAFAITKGEETVHDFAWSADSQSIYFVTRQPWSKSQKDDYKKEWKDVVQYRTAERGDTIFSLSLATALSAQAVAKPDTDSDNEKDKEDLTPGAEAIATIPLRVDKLLVSPDGHKLALLTNSINQRQEKAEDVELYVINFLVSRRAFDSKGNPDPDRPKPMRVTNNQAVETHPHWANDSRHIFFTVEVGDVYGPYRDLQPHLYLVNTDRAEATSPDVVPGAVEQWSKDFIGPIDQYAVDGNTVLASARNGTEVQMYSASKLSDPLHRVSNWPGTYAQISTATHSSKIAFAYSALDKPEEIYVADSADKLNEARAITSFNKLFTERDLPRGKPYQWKADDGTTVEGMLIFPPCKFEQKHLPMFTFIHGGPADADGNHFEADWYQWAALAATNGWLVFEPNYRGSVGYGDKFLMQIVPQIVSRPGKDILEGVDALVKDGIADPDHLTVGGYSYGGYMTNWLITQTTRFKAAVTGAGAVEHIGNWGNDDTTMDDAYFLGGRPWESRAALSRRSRHLSDRQGPHADAYGRRR